MLTGGCGERDFARRRSLWLKFFSSVSVMAVDAVLFHFVFWDFDGEAAAHVSFEGAFK